MEKKEVYTKIIIIKNNMILLGKRMENYDYGLLEFPGGKIKEDEDIIFGSIREVEEECGLKIKIKNHNIMQTYKELIPFHIFQDKFLRLGMIFIGEIIGGKIKNTNEMTDARFYKKSEIKKLIENNKIRDMLIPCIKSWLLNNENQQFCHTHT